MQKKPAHRVMYLEDGLNALYEMEHTAAELENSDLFERFTNKEKAQCRNVLHRLRTLIHDLEQDTIKEQLAS